MLKKALRPKSLIIGQFLCFPFSVKYLEIMYQRLYEFRGMHKLFKMQSGFRSGHSIDLVLVNVTESITSSLDNNRVGCGIFFDPQKAFDTVNHDILLKKLEHYGLSGTASSCFKSYMSDCKQFVSVNDIPKLTSDITWDVPQKLVVGPLLFLIYINGSPNSSKVLTFFLFADDTAIYFESDDLES